MSIDHSSYVDIPSVLPWFRGWQLMTAPYFCRGESQRTAPPTSPGTARRSPLRRDQCLRRRWIPMDGTMAPWSMTASHEDFIYGYGSIPMKIPLIPFLVGWTSINPSYFDVNRRGTRFWHTAICSEKPLTEHISEKSCLSGWWLRYPPLWKIMELKSMGFGWHPQLNGKITNWLVVEPPLWKIWLRQLGSLFQIYGKSSSIHVPVTTNQWLLTINHH